MTTRFSFPSPPGTLSTGYDNQKVSDVTIPPCGIEDVDVAVFKLFDKEIPFIVKNNDPTEPNRTRKVPVIFAAGEKWAMLKNNRPIRDKAGTLILPLITVARTEIAQDSSADVTGRGINQQTGVLTIRRKLDQSDRAYQSIINKLYVMNQKNLAVNPLDPNVNGQVLTDGALGSLVEDPDRLNGALMAPNRLKNIYETLTIPAPQFYTAKYEVTLWAQYTQQMNAMLEVFISSFLPQGRCFKLTTDKGYWFVANVDESYSQENNYDDMSQQERIIKHKINISVPAYILASSAPGVPIPVRKHISAPTVEFNISPIGVGSSGTEELNYPYLGADDPTLPLQDSGKFRRVDGRDDNSGPLSSPVGSDPALKGYPRGRIAKYAKIGNKLIKGSIVSSFNGETSYKGQLNTENGVGDFDIIVK